jgi:AraC-like DNA-binding protein
MTIALSDTTWHDLWETSWQQARYADPSDNMDAIAECPPRMGKGYKRDILLRNGIELTFHQYEFHDDLISLRKTPEETGCLEWVFNLSSIYKPRGGTYISSGQHYLTGLFLPRGKGEDRASEPKLAVDLHLKPESFRRLIGDCLNILPPDLQRMLAADETLPFSSVWTITPTMQRVLRQMLDCPYQGAIKQMYLESKSVEILALWLEQVTSSHDSPPPSTNLQPDDIDRIHQAKEILIRHLDNPPSLLALARQVGLNDCTLKRGFRQVFGTTVFGYLHRHRMEQARQLLLDGEMKVEEVANAVGYANRSRFAAAFRKKFGTNPKSYLMEFRRLG